MNRVRWTAMYRSVSALVVVVLLGGCGLAADKTYTLGVPYRSQGDVGNLCGAASVLMWRLYDGLHEIPASEIYTWMNNNYPVCASNQLGIADAVNVFTLTRDATWDVVSVDYQRESIARQITSIDAGAPVIAIVDFNHTGVINGGRWHEEGSYYVWDTLFFHDPARGPDQEIAAESWIWRYCYDTCEQILSWSAAGNWYSNEKQFGDLIKLYSFDPHHDDDPPAV